MAEVTRWFEFPAERPVRKGWYETRRFGERGAWIVIWLWWTGTSWVASRKSKHYTFDATREWRGLAGPAR